ncbi:MAG: UPF0175 family protein [Desulfobacteraceae bacterium]|nr:UPF0175 family protein [Desulfobacteraceae bacterium]
MPQAAPRGFVKQLRLAAAIHWYTRKEISMEKGSIIAGIDRVDFLEALASRQVNVFNVDMESLNPNLILYFENDQSKSFTLSKDNCGLMKNPKIYVAGHRGMVGSAIVRRLKAMKEEALPPATIKPKTWFALVKKHIYNMLNTKIKNEQYYNI